MRKLRRFAHGLQLTITDFVAEVHDTHHPISTGLYYEDQKAADEATRRGLPRPTASPNILAISSERSQPQSGGRRRIALGDALSTVDLSLFQLWAGMTYAFPRAFADAAAR